MRIIGQYESLGTPLAARHRPVESLYIHIPFCFHKCHYCDFFSVVGSAAQHERFVETLCRELQTLAPHAGPLRTVFIGGGTPTHLAPALWRRLLETLDCQFDLTPILSGEGEFTVECNPETASSELFDILARGGVNRLSVGAQSFDTAVLESLERWHEPANVERTLRLAAQAGIQRLSIDLIYGVPGQSLDAWLRDLETALAMETPIGHISCYALTVETDTPLAVRIRRGEMAPPDEELQTEMQSATLEFLRGRAFDRYEVSNYARTTIDGGPSEHNLVYWRQGAWLAAGPSAAGHLLTDDGGWRWRNAPHITDWMNGVLETGAAPVLDLEAPSMARLIRERIMTGVRLREGADIRAIEALAAESGIATACTPVIERMQRRGLAEFESGRLRLTDAGMLHADGLAADLMAAVGE